VRRRYLSATIPFKDKNRIFLWEGSKKHFFRVVLALFVKECQPSRMGFTKGIKLLVYPGIEEQRKNRCVAAPDRTDAN
jgi:hypothetical protein